MAKATSTPTAIPVTTPLPGKPPTGKTFVFLQCDFPTCPFQGQGVEEAAKAIGWNVKVLNFKLADASTLVAAMKTALQYHPVAVSFSGIAQQLWAPMAAQFAAAHALIIPSYVYPAPKGPGTETGHGFAPDGAQLGTLLADEVVAQANGSPAHILYINVPSSTTYTPTTKAYHAELSKLCPACTTDEIDFTFPQLAQGGLPSAVVSELKRHSDINQIVSVNGTFVNQLPQALSAAGLAGKYPIFAGDGDSITQKQIQDGAITSCVNEPFRLGGFQDVDIAIRHVMNLPIPDGDHRVPPYLLTKQNIKTPSDSYDLPTDYAAQFEKLWHVSTG